MGGGAGECEEESRKRGLLGERVEEDLRSWSHCSSHAVALCMRNTAALKRLGNLGEGEAGGRDEEEDRGGREGDDGVSLNSRTLCRWMRDITDLSPNLVRDSYQRPPALPHTPASRCRVQLMFNA